MRRDLVVLIAWMVVCVAVGTALAEVGVTGWWVVAVAVVIGTVGGRVLLARHGP